MSCTDTIKGRIWLCTHVDHYTQRISFYCRSCREGFEDQNITIMGLDRACLKARAAARAVQVTASSRGSNQRGSGTYTPHVAQNQTWAPWQGELGCCTGLCRGLGGHTRPAKAPQLGAAALEATEGNCWQLVVSSRSRVNKVSGDVTWSIQPRGWKIWFCVLTCHWLSNSCFSSHREICFSWCQN